MKKNLLLSFFLCLALGPAMAQTNDFKVIGYLPYYRFAYNSQIEYERLTHVNLAFANPDMSGQLSLDGQDPTPVIEAAHQAGAEVFISLAGGALTPAWEAAWEHLMLPENRSAFIHQIMVYVAENAFDGVDFDLEWSHVNEKYSPFVLELRDSMDAHGLPLTAALPGTYRYPDISEEALAAFDWVNMMAYDLTGSWDPNNPGPHSPYSFALNSMFYWQGQGVPKPQLTLGVPFYGYNFGTSPVSSARYATIVGWDPANAWVDQVDEVYYNGIPTIVDKTELALSQLGGIMIWELGQDDFSDLSLLRAIDETVNGVTQAEDELPLAARAYPNPLGAALIVENPGPEVLLGRLFDSSGRPLAAAIIQPGTDYQYPTLHLPAGLYVLNLQSGGVQRSIKLVKP